MLAITHANYLGASLFELAFNNGRSGIADARPLLVGADRAFTRLSDESFAADFSLAHGTLCWPGELDVAPEYLYFLTFSDDPAEQARFQAWGYTAA